MVDEFYRILKPGGFYITFSLHTVVRPSDRQADAFRSLPTLTDHATPVAPLPQDQIAKFFRNRKQHRSYQWTHSGVMVMNSNYGKSDSGASQAYAVMVCQKHGGDGVPRVDIAAKLASFEAKVRNSAGGPAPRLQTRSSCFCSVHSWTPRKRSG